MSVIARSTKWVRMTAKWAGRCAIIALAGIAGHGLVKAQNQKQAVIEVSLDFNWNKFEVGSVGRSLPPIAQIPNLSNGSPFSIKTEVVETPEWIDVNVDVFVRTIYHRPGEWRLADRPELAQIAADLAVYVSNIERRYGQARLGSEILFEGGADGQFRKGSVRCREGVRELSSDLYVGHYPPGLPPRKIEADVDGEMRTVSFSPGAAISNAELAVLRAVELKDSFVAIRRALVNEPENLSEKIVARTSCEKGSERRYARITVRMKRLTFVERLLGGMEFMLEGGALTDHSRIIVNGSDSMSI